MATPFFNHCAAMDIATVSGIKVMLTSYHFPSKPTWWPSMASKARPTERLCLTLPPFGDNLEWDCSVAATHFWILPMWQPEPIAYHQLVMAVSCGTGIGAETQCLREKIWVIFNLISSRAPLTWTWMYHFHLMLHHSISLLGGSDKIQILMDIAIK